MSGVLSPLTPNQEAATVRLVQRWVDLAFSTEPADFDAAKAAIEELLRGCTWYKPGKIAFRQSCRRVRCEPFSFGFPTDRLVRRPFDCPVMQQTSNYVGQALRLTGRPFYFEFQICAMLDYWTSELGFSGADFFNPGISERKVQLLTRAVQTAWAYQWEDKPGLLAVIDRPAAIYLNARPVLSWGPDGLMQNTVFLHHDGGPSILWRDGWRQWHLNGVEVPQWLAETDFGKIPPKRIIEIKNAEVRREFVRKVGIDRIAYKLGAETVDQQGDYTLLRIRPGEDRTWTYLKMQCPSTGLWHVEGVPNTCQTVAEALAWRKPPRLAKIPVDENGEDWYQQGDVCIWPKKAKRLKPNPKTLT